MHTPSVNQTREGVPEYVERSTVLKEVYAALADEVKRELDAGVRDFGIRTLARVYAELHVDDIYVYVLMYDIADDGTEWVTVVAPKGKADFRIAEGIIWLDGEEYLPKDYATAIELVKRILKDVAELRNGDWRVATAAAEYISKFRELLGEPL